MSYMNTMRTTEVMEAIKNSSACNDPQVKSMSPAALAYIGDVLFEMYVRDYLLHQPQTNIDQLHKKAVTYVKASSQALMIKHLTPYLTDEEQAAVRRGRNGKMGTVPRNADATDYRYATGFEALLGWLYYQNETARLVQVMEKAVQLLEKERQEENHTHEAI